MTIQNIIDSILATENIAALEEIRIGQLGKKGYFTEQLKTLGSLPPEERKLKGQELNIAKQQISEAIDKQAEILKLQEINARLEQEWLDVTLPPRTNAQGFIHPISKVLQEISDIFSEQGFAIAEGPEIEDDWHNFGAMNLPEDHPARDMQDTFYINQNPAWLLRTDTMYECKVAMQDFD
ncbi:MAG: hypothetical protein WCL30_06185 [Pseudomonadota bacterium]